MTRPFAKNKLLTWSIAILLLAGAWFVTFAAPTTDVNPDAFAISTELGTHVEGRNIAATIHEVRAAHAITGPDGWRLEGTWVVVDLDAAAVATQYGTLLALATLTVGDDVYRATERGETGLTMLNVALVPGIPKTGSLAFQVPDDALTGSATLRIGSTSDPVYDSTIIMTVSLDELDLANEIDIVPTDWSRG